MTCRTCCCCSPRAGARLVGALDLLLGILGIAVVGYLLVDVRREEEDNEIKPVVNGTEMNLFDGYENLWTLAVVLIFPSVLNIIVGLTTLIAVSMNSKVVGRLSYAFTILLIIGSIGLYAICFFLGYHWLDIIPLLLWGGLQIIFVCAIQDFIKMELHTETV